MNRNRPWHFIIASGLLGSLAGCTEPNTPTALRSSRPAFDEAAALASVITDPVGDVKNKAAAWQDIVQSDVAKTGRTFVFTTDLADAVPSNPPAAPGGLGILSWLWELDTDPTAFPQDGVLPPGQSIPEEFFVDVEWDGAEFTGKLYDNRPLLTGGALVITPVPFSIEGAELKVFVTASALGDPSTFGWASATVTRPSHLGSEGFQVFDRAPDAGFVAWPQ